MRAVVVAARGSQPREHAGAARLVQAFDERGGVIQISALDREERLGLVDALQERKRVTPAQAPPRLLQYVSRDAFFAGDVLHARQREHRQQRRVDVALLGAERAGAFEIVASGIEPVALEVHDTAHVAGCDREPELGVSDIARGVERVVGERFGFREAALRQRDLAEHAGDGDPVGGVVRIRAATNSSNVAWARAGRPINDCNWACADGARSSSQDHSDRSSSSRARVPWRAALTRSPCAKSRRNCRYARRAMASPSPLPSVPVTSPESTSWLQSCAPSISPM